MAHLNIKKHIIEPVYPGRFMIIGRDDSGMITIVYGLMGGSAGSKNRDLTFDRNNGLFTIRTTPVNDSEKWVPNPEITLYDAIRMVTFADKTKGIIVSNGRQTDDMAVMDSPDQFESVLSTWEHEGADFDNTSRISGLVHFGEGGLGIKMSIISADKEDLEKSVHQNFLLDDLVGKGHFISTYKGERDGDGKLPAFDEPNPVVMPLVGTTEEIAAGYMGVLSLKYRVSLAVVTLRENATIYGCSIINYGRDPEEAEVERQHNEQRGFVDPVKTF